MDASLLKESQVGYFATPNSGFGSNPLCPHPVRPLQRVGHRTRTHLQKQVAEACPAVPGVYGMLDRAGDLIYVGKSKSLRHRVMSYFTSCNKQEKSGRIIESTRAVQWETKPSEFAALLREQQLIRRYLPRWNVQGMPNRQRPVYLCLGRAPAAYFFTATTPPKDLISCEGPFYGAARMKCAVDSLNQFFKLRDCSQKTVFHFADQMALFELQHRAGCLRYETGSCLGPCAGACTRAGYDSQVLAAQSFLDAFNDEPIVTMREAMEQASANQQYELAARRLKDWEALDYLYRKLVYLAEARRAYSFVYPVRGFDGQDTWYLIRAGEVSDSMVAPRCTKTLAAVRPQMKAWSSQLQNPFDHGTGRHSHTVNLVASWFRKNRPELSQTFSPSALKSSRAWIKNRQAS
jgi:excinuclease ABC subunit C